MFGQFDVSSYDRPNNDHYGTKPCDTTNLVTVTHFVHIDHTVNNGGGSNGTITLNRLLYSTGANPQRGDRLTHNPAYNLELKIWGRLRELIGLPNHYSAITKDTLVRVPNTTRKFPAACDPIVNGYGDGYIPQFMDGWVRGHESTIGKAEEIVNFTAPLVSFIGDDSGRTMSTFNFVDKRTENDYTEMNHHAMSGTADSSGLYMALTGAMLQTMGLSAADPDVAAYLGLTQSMLPLNRVVDSEATFKVKANGIDIVVAANIGVGTPLTPITFPENFALRVAAGDILALGWRWNPMNPNVEEHHYVRYKIFMDINQKKIYDSKVALVNLFKSKYPAVNAAIPDAVAYVSGLFTDFGLDKTRVPDEYQDLISTWVDTGFSSIAKSPTIPPGKSIIYGKENSFSAKGRIALVQPLVRNHCKRATLLASSGLDVEPLVICKPNNSDTFLATHDTVYQYGMFGPGTPFIDMHNHPGDNCSHLPTDGLNSEVYAPGSSGPIVEDSNVLLRCVTVSDNPHDTYIDAAGIFITYWYKV